MPLPVYVGGAVALLAATLVVARVALAKRRARESFAEADPDQYKLENQIRARQSRWLLWVLGAFVWFAVALIASVGIGQSVGGGSGGTTTSVGLVLCFFGVAGCSGASSDGPSEWDESSASVRRAMQGSRDVQQSPRDQAHPDRGHTRLHHLWRHVNRSGVIGLAIHSYSASRGL